jgi:hypothetical protein
MRTRETPLAVLSDYEYDVEYYASIILVAIQDHSVSNVNNPQNR